MPPPPPPPLTRAVRHCRAMSSLYMEGRQDTESKTLMKNVDGIGAFLFVKAIRPTLA